MQPQQVAMIRVRDIVPDPAKYNQPRQRFGEKEMASLRETIRARGVIQAITVRPHEDGKYMIIAGERRWRAAREVFGDDYEMPTVIRVVDHVEALSMALIENDEREAIGPAEEAEAIDRLATAFKGDLEQVAAHQGWSLQKVKRRLALMRAIPEVRAALMEARISIGHAEILAAAPQELQAKALPRVIEKRLTVDEVKNALMARTHVLAKAVFDRTECEQCPSNTGIQRALFSNVLDEGRCTNPACFDEKTLAAVSATAAALRETYPRVEILRIDTRIPVTSLEIEGANGVGSQQAKACRACKDFGATVSALPGEHGAVSRSQCFDLACNAQKRAAHVESLKHPAPATPAGEGMPQDIASTRSGAAAKLPGANAKASAAPARPTLDAKSLRQAIIDHRRPIWQKALQRIALKEHALALRLLIVLAASGELRSLPADEYEAAAAKALSASSIEKPGKGLDAVMAGDDASTAKLLAGIVAAAAVRMSAETLELLLVASGKPTEDHWQVDRAFLELLTKSEIDVVAREIGLARHLGETYKPLLGKRKDELIAALVDGGFEFARKVPSFMKWRS